MRKTAQITRDQVFQDVCDWRGWGSVKDIKYNGFFQGISVKSARKYLDELWQEGKLLKAEDLQQTCGWNKKTYTQYAYIPVDLAPRSNFRSPRSDNPKMTEKDIISCTYPNIGRRDTRNMGFTLTIRCSH